MTEFHSIKRRGFLGGALAAFPLAFLGQSPKEPSAMAVAPVRAGEDRLGEPHTIGISSTAFKVLTADSAGALFLFEHTNSAGIAEIGSTRMELKPGDSILGPREVPHAWAFVGNASGRLLIAFAPANKMEAFFRDNEKRRKGNEYTNDAEIYRSYGMELLGPPLSVK